jgi:hypothetical protein
MRTPSGLINQRIEIYSDQDIKDGSGGVIPNSVVYWATTAHVRPIAARRDLGQAQEIFQPAFTFEISDRNDKTVKPNMLIKYRGAWLTITNCVPDYPYVQKLTITAITSDPIVRTISSVLTIRYGYSDTDYIGDEENIPFQFDMQVASMFSSLTIPFPLAASGKYLFFEVPSGQTVFDHYFINETNEGEIPSFRWYDMNAVNGNDYYLSRTPIILDEETNNIIFTRNGL